MCQSCLQAAPQCPTRGHTDCRCSLGAIGRFLPFCWTSPGARGRALHQARPPCLCHPPWPQREVSQRKEPWVLATGKARHARHGAAFRRVQGTASHGACEHQPSGAQTPASHAGPSTHLSPDTCSASVQLPEARPPSVHWEALWVPRSHPIASSLAASLLPFLLPPPLLSAFHTQPVGAFLPHTSLSPCCHQSSSLGFSLCSGHADLTSRSVLTCTCEGALQPPFLRPGQPSPSPS